MKKLFILSIIVCHSVLNAQIVDIPDANFKDTLINFPCVDTDGDDIPDSDADTNDDGEIQVSEAEAVLQLYVSSRNIDSLEGIASFTNIEVLFCDFNNLTELDVTANQALKLLLCASNDISSLDVTQNVNLEQLWCASNELTSLDLSQNALLNRLSCGANNIGTLDVTQNQELGILTCAANGMTDLFTSNQNLTEIYCWMNDLTDLDVSQNPNLIVLSCRDNDLSSLDLRNGANFNIATMFAYGNPNLNCILVDDETALFPECDLDVGVGWCADDTAEYSEDCILGVAGVEAQAIGLYPNPAKDVIRIDTQVPIEHISVYTANGQRVMSTDGKVVEEVDVSQLPIGLYFIQAKSTSQFFTAKLLKE